MTTDWVTTVYDVLESQGGTVKGVSLPDGRYRTALVRLTEAVLGREMLGTTNEDDHAVYSHVSAAVIDLEEMGLVRVLREHGLRHHRANVIYHIEAL